MKIIHGVSQAEACLKTRLPVNVEFHVNRFISLFVNSTFLLREERAQRLLLANTMQLEFYAKISLLHFIYLFFIIYFVYLHLRNYEKQFKDLGIWYEHRLIDDMVS